MSELTDVIGADYFAAVAGLILWLALVIFQLADFGSSVLDERNAFRTEDRARAATQRFADYFWALPLVAFVSLGIVLGVVYSARLILDSGETARGVVVLLALTGLVLFMGIGILVGVTRRERASYVSVIIALKGVSGARLPKREVEALRMQLAAIDDREREFSVGRRNTSSYRSLKTELDRLVRGFAAHAPRGLEVFDAVRWRSAARFLTTSSAWRLVPVFVAAVPLVASLTSGAAEVAFLGIPLWVPLLVPVPLSFLIALGASKASLAAKVSRRAANEVVRAEAERLLAGLDRGSRKGVAGLGDRVARALQILREQQG